MKTNLNIASLILLAATTLFTACKDDSDENKGFDEPNGDIVSELTVEEHKKNLENEGIAFVSKMSKASDLESYNVINTLFELTEESEFAYSTVLRRISNPTQNAHLKSSFSDDLGLSISETFNDEAGIYEWSDSEADFIKVSDATDKISYSFKVDNETAIVLINNVNTKTVMNSDGSMSLEVPTSFNASLTLGTSVLINFTFTGEYYDNATPKYLKEALNVEGFYVESVIDLKNKELVKVNNKLEYNSDNIFAFGFAIDGNIDMDEIMDEASDMDEDGNPSANQDIINKANAYFQIGNIKVDGLVNAKELIKYMSQNSNNGFDDEWTEEDATEEATKLNEYIQTYIRYADSKAIFAKGEFYVNKEINSWYNYYTQEEESETYYNSELRVVYPDGSAVSSDIFESGFSDLIVDMNKMIVDMNNSYDLDLEEM